MGNGWRDKLGSDVLAQVTGLSEKRKEGLDRVGLAVAGGGRKAATVEISQIRLQITQAHDLPGGEVASRKEGYKVGQIALVFFTGTVAVVTGGHVDGFKVRQASVQGE